MKTRTALAAGAVLMLAVSARAADRPCQIHASKSATRQELAAKARVSETDAKAAALAALGVPAGKAVVQESELEVEDGCLVYSFDIQVSGEKGVREVQVDAGDGKVLKTEHEDEATEAKEKAKEKERKEKR
jgi:uncharacterized membrane protein YkoI